MKDELRRLERRRGRSGKDRVDHPPMGSDDVANAVAGAVNLVIAKPGFNANALPTGVGNQGIGAMIKKEIGSVLGEPNPFTDGGKPGVDEPIGTGDRKPDEYEVYRGWFGNG